MGNQSRMAVNVGNVPVTWTRATVDFRSTWSSATSSVDSFSRRWSSSLKSVRLGCSDGNAGNIAPDATLGECSATLEETTSPPSKTWWRTKRLAPVSSLEEGWMEAMDALIFGKKREQKGGSPLFSVLKLLPRTGDSPVLKKSIARAGRQTYQITSMTGRWRADHLCYVNSKGNALPGSWVGPK